MQGYRDIKFLKCIEESSNISIVNKIKGSYSTKVGVGAFYLF